MCRWHLIVSTLCTMYLTTSQKNEGQNWAKLYKMVTDISKIDPWKTSKWTSKVWESHLMVTLTSKLELQGFLYRNFNSHRTCVANSRVVTPTQPKIQALNLHPLALMTMWRRRRKKEEKQKNRTCFTKYHGKIIVTTNNYLPYNIYLHKSHQRLFYIVGDYESRLIFSSWFVQALY